MITWNEFTTEVEQTCAEILNRLKTKPDVDEQEMFEALDQVIHIGIYRIPQIEVTSVPKDSWSLFLDYLTSIMDYWRHVGDGGDPDEAYRIHGYDHYIVDPVVSCFWHDLEDLVYGYDKEE